MFRLRYVAALVALLFVALVARRAHADCSAVAKEEIGTIHETVEQATLDGTAVGTKKDCAPNAVCHVIFFSTSATKPTAPPASPGAGYTAGKWTQVGTLPSSNTCRNLWEFNYQHTGQALRP